jgi:hypothetical protein
MSNINQYPLEAFQINDEDFYDVDYWNGASYETRKISGATLKSILSGGAEFLNDLQDVNTDLPLTPTNADDGRILYFDIDSGNWISDDIANIANVVKDCKTSVATGSIPKGTPVYYAGFDNDLLVVEAADASDPLKMPCIGIVAEDLDDTNAKKVISFGKLQGVDTSAFANGDVLYVAAGGGLTTTRPTGNSEIQRIATILKSDNPGGLMKIYNTSREAGLPNLQTGNIWHGDADSYPEEIALCPIILTDLEAADTIAICRWNGSSFDRFAITGASILSLADNIYSADGVLSGPRTVDIGGQTLIFNDSSALDGPLVEFTQFLTKLAWQISPAAGDQNSIYSTATLICIETANSGVPIELVSDIIKFSNKTSGVSAIMDTSVMNADRTFTLQDQSGTIALLSDIPSAAEKHIDSFYAFDMSQAANYSWNGINVGNSTLVTINESIRAQDCAGVGGADGCYVNGTMPSYYNFGDSLKVTINVTYLAVGGDFVLNLGLQEPRVGGLIGDDTSTIWNSQTQPTVTAESAVSMVFIVSGFSELFALSPFALKIYRDPGNAADTFTGDVYINSVLIEIQ